MNQPKFESIVPQNRKVLRRQTAMNLLLTSLVEGSNKPPKPSNSPDEIPNWVAIIVPDSQIHVKQTVRYLTELFSAASYGQFTGTYTNQFAQVEEELNWLVISWCDGESLEKNWEAIIDHAAFLQEALRQECIGVLRNGTLILVRHWGK